MNKETIQRRRKSASDLNKKLEAIWKVMDKVPSFKGKASLIDKVLRAKTLAHNLEFNLVIDSSELE